MHASQQGVVSTISKVGDSSLLGREIAHLGRVVKDWNAGPCQPYGGLWVEIEALQITEFDGQQFKVWRVKPTNAAAVPGLVRDSGRIVLRGGREAPVYLMPVDGGAALRKLDLSVQPLIAIADAFDANDLDAEAR